MNFSKANCDNFNNRLRDKYPDLYQYRFCDQEDFSIVICSGEKVNEDIYHEKPFLLNNFDTKVYLPRYFKSRKEHKSVSNGSDLYVLGFHDASGFCDVENYSYLNKCWKTLQGSYLSSSFYLCIFMQKLFVMDDSSQFYDKKTNKWWNTSAMYVKRRNAACTVFEGKIVVSGGFSIRLRYLSSNYIVTQLNSVEAYDHHENKWYYYPRMLETRRNHTAVSIKNKMFVIGGEQNNNSCEVFHSFTRKFTFIKSQISLINQISPSKIVSIGNNIYFFVKDESKDVKVYSYDVKNNFYCFKTCLKFENSEYFSCTKVPMH